MPTKYTNRVIIILVALMLCLPDLPASQPVV